MRVLSVFQTYSFFGSGNTASEINVIAQQFQELGHQVDILSASYDGVSGDLRSENGINVECLGSILRFRFMTINPGLILFCKRNLRRYDVVHIYGIYDLFGPIVSWFCRRWKIPYVVEPMGMYRPIVRSLLIKRLYHLTLGGPVVRGAMRIITTSDQERAEVLNGGVSIDRIVIRRNGLDMRQFECLPPRGAFRVELGISEEESLILFLGRLSRVKGLDLLIKAFARVDLPARLVLVGPDDEDGTIKEIERLCREMDLGTRVLLPGPRFGQDKLQVLADSDIFVLPSVHENFGNAALEAAASGIPVIVTDQCGVASHIEDKSGLVVSRDEDSLVSAINELIVNCGLRERFKANAVHIRQDFSWKEPILFQQQMYQELVAD